ncbi:MAG: hypothetical protein JNN16_17425 [Nitrospira sp.]|nr:hypothetical protein [Nitrospira sp.]
MDLIKINEPGLLFKYGQSMEDPRDGLSLFGPLDEGKPYGIRAGVIGTKDGIKRYKNWVRKIQGPIASSKGRTARPPFPGIEAAFRIPWVPEPQIAIEISEVELKASLYLDDKYQRVFKTVDVYARRIIEAIRQEDTKVDLWFVVIPDEVKRYCRPMSSVETGLQIVAQSKLPVAYAKSLQSFPSLFEEHNIAAVPYAYEVNFHNQLKARLLEYDAPIQILQESTIAHREFLNKFGVPNRNLEELESAIAWNIATTAFYKAGGRPWKIGSIRDGVCYVGLVFKQDDKNAEPGSSCCAAQMFLDSGDGVVFKGAVGPWHRPGKGGFHLKKEAARELIQLAVNSYAQKQGAPPKELFLHGKVRFNDEEWEGFESGVGSATNLVGVRIRDTGDIKLFRKGKHPVLRGVAFVRDDRTAFVWTKGFTPRLQTYPGREVPKPLLVDVCRGKVAIETVLNDIMALTKLNYNACIFADGEPVTLKFADSVGEILTAGPLGELPPLPFKYYI